uniref:Uncharacterized protein n=1 Tax=Meloidogyne hapla TaxID=6305 RepID=A0A1I8BQ93_MELHA
MVYNLLVNEETNEEIDEENIKNKINEYISSNENLTMLDHVIKACNQANYHDIPTMDKIFKFLNGDIDLPTFEEPEQERHYEYEETSHGGHEGVSHGHGGYEHRESSTGHGQRRHGCFNPFSCFRDHGGD